MKMRLSNLGSLPYSTDIESTDSEMIRVLVPGGGTVDVDNVDPYRIGQDPFLRQAVVQGQLSYVWVSDAGGRVATPEERGGLGQYADTGASSALTADTWTSIPNDSANTFLGDTFTPESISTLLDPSTGAIDVSDGGGFAVSVPNDLNRVGRDRGNNYMRDGCAVDGISLFTSALTSSEVTTVYNSGTPSDLSSFSPAPVIWYRMGDGDTFPTISDNIGSLDLTMVNMTAGNFVNDVP